MKKAGLIVFAIGLLITVITGINYVSREVVVESGDLTLTRDVNHGFSWSPVIGIALMVVGGMIFISGFRRQKLQKDQHKPYFKR
jgi:hypothetical protein